MNEEMQMRLDRIDSSVSKLIQSISTGAAAQDAASELLDADCQLSASLHRLAEHQRNHATIVALRQTSIHLDDKLASSIKLLADLRSELLSAKINTRSPSQPVATSSLLQYAASIAKFSKPLPMTDPRRRQPQSDMLSPGTQVKRESPATSTGLDNPLEIPKGSDLRLSPAEADWIGTQSMSAFVPWPSEDVIRQGHLYLSQNNLSQAPEIETQQTVPMVEPLIKDEHLAQPPSQPGEPQQVGPEHPIAAPRVLTEPKKEVQYAGLDDFDMDDD